MVIFGTRPEAIKLAPVICALRENKYLEMVTVSTSQHRQMLQDVLDLFEIVPTYDLKIMQDNQTLGQIVEKSTEGFRKIFTSTKPDVVLVQGDTTTAFIGALMSFYNRIPVGHVEAGLRTWNMISPYPEEANRTMISAVTTHHFAPTEGNKNNLIRSGISADRILVTGNTVIDALRYVVEHKPLARYGDEFLIPGGKMILVTAHRRENFGEPLENICYSILDISRRYPNVSVVYPVHLNPNVQKPVKGILHGQQRIHLIQPLNYQKMCALMSRAHLILTDSGGIQEEAPSLGKPVVLMREETERPEAVKAGTVVVAGTSRQKITEYTFRLLDDEGFYRVMAQSVNPYGDGKAAGRIVKFLYDYS